jgi:hypothetical protein
MKSSNWHGGKGSGRRSGQNDKTYSDNWDAIFGKKQADIAEQGEKVREEAEKQLDLFSHDREPWHNRP